jgi:hypothetical protein
MTAGVGSVASALLYTRKDSASIAMHCVTRPRHAVWCQARRGSKQQQQQQRRQRSLRSTQAGDQASSGQGGKHSWLQHTPRHWLQSAGIQQRRFTCLASRATAGAYHVTAPVLQAAHSEIASRAVTPDLHATSMGGLVSTMSHLLPRLWPPPCSILASMVPVVRTCCTDCQSRRCSPDDALL